MGRQSFISDFAEFLSLFRFGQGSEGGCRLGHELALGYLRRGQFSDKQRMIKAPVPENGGLACSLSDRFDVFDLSAVVIEHFPLDVGSFAAQ